MSEEDPASSIRQLPPGQLDIIRKRFESDSESPQVAENGVQLRSKPPSHASPVHERPTTTVLDSPRRAMNREGVRPRSAAFIPSSSPKLSKVLNKFEAKGNGENLNTPPNPRPREPSPQKLTPAKPALSKKPSFTKDNNEKPPISRKPSLSTPGDKKKLIPRASSVSSEEENEKQSKSVAGSVVQRRTQMFESGDSPSVTNVKSTPPPRPAPPSKPTSRPPSVGSEEQEGPVYSEVIKRKKPSGDEDSNSQYCEAWDQRPVSKLIGSPAKQVNARPQPPPKKPPRTGAHDEYMQLKKQGVTFQLYDDVPDEGDSPVYKKITKPSHKDSHSKPEIRMARPSRPPPPRVRPVTISGESISKEESSVQGELPHKPFSLSSLNVYEEVNGGDFSISNIKHWDLPTPAPPETTSITRHGSSNLKRSLSMDSLMGNPVYCDPALTVNFRDDSEIYVDSAGYAMPLGSPTHKTLGNSASLDTYPTTGGICRPISHAVMKQLKKLKPGIKPKRATARENWKKLQNVKMKINLAFAVVRHMKGEHKTESAGESSDVDSLVDENEIKKRLVHCGSVRKNTSKSIRRAQKVQTQTYNQMFDFCLIVGLHTNDDYKTFQPKIIYKFPDLVESNANIPAFCFPDAEEFDVKSASAAAPSESYSFVLTNVEGERVYGYCRRMVPFCSKAGLPEVICIISPVDAFSMYNELLDAAEECRHKSLDLAKELLSAAFGRPLPEPGKVVQVRTLDENWDTGTILLSRPEDFRVDNVNREYLLSKLGVDKLLKLFSCMLLERSILFCAKNLSILSQTIHALVALLYPFRWQHTYIPVLPESMLDVTCSPTPFIIGILSSHLPYVQKLPISEIVIFDLNKKQMLKSQGDEGTLLPKDIQKALKTALNMCKVDAEIFNQRIAEAKVEMQDKKAGKKNKGLLKILMP
uniref:Suppression of tumorigenicity 5 n=1 Tax=Magallana gigas TaxID=29159 RepID=K1QQT9_MAGGI